MKFIKTYTWVIAMVLGVNLLSFDVVWQKYLFYAVVIILVNWREA
jgi:hypothetical protein